TKKCRTLDAYKEEIKKKGEELVKEVFPQRVFEIEELLKSELLARATERDTIDVPIPVPKSDSVCPPTKKRMLNEGDGHGLTPVFHFPCGEFPLNSSIKELFDLTRPLCQRLVFEAQNVRLWIQFSIPRIEDGNNFGVGIQEDVLSEVASIERDAITYMEGITRYYAARGKMVSKIAQFPHINDYREALIEQDIKQAFGMHLTLLEIRNHYAMLNDLIMKNLDRIKVPRSNHSVSLY
ncbi:Proteasome activator complex subunit 3, partial [Cichlidogyrus casuarinus]